MKDRELAIRIAESAAEMGGRVYYVGGCVRDALRGIESVDLDIEVYGLTSDALVHMLSAFGEVTDKGARFGVYGLKGSDLDIALPRTETRSGDGHKDFDVTPDPFLPKEVAVSRRDFTVNALMQDVLTGEVIDLVGGREDLEKGILRCVKPRSFVEDPLRVLRGAQFAARFRLTPDPETLACMHSMNIGTLPKERVFAETEKALLSADAPSQYFRILNACGQLRVFFPELADCIGVEQSPVHHPEGDVFEHTMLALDCAARIRKCAIRPSAFMLSVLFHDLGKIVATVKDEEGKITSHRHETLGVPMIDTAMRRLTGDREVIRYVCNQAELHMRPNLLAASRSRRVKTRLLFDMSVCPEDLILLARADASGKTDRPYPDEYGTFLEERLADYRKVIMRPMLTGTDLIAAGFRPGKDFGKIVKRARHLHLSGSEPKAALAQLKREFADCLN